MDTEITWPTQEMLGEIEKLQAKEFLEDSIDAIYFEDDDYEEECKSACVKTRSKGKTKIGGTVNRRTGEIVTLGDYYADYTVWRELKDWDSVFKNPGYQGLVNIDFQALCLPDPENKPWM